ncbi:hypothetical protein JOD43_004431 [Pullulanibacillus pueri]|uniref:Uncharacterized protein n=1 Tax=Pullulanibacillus pueri TaxID=1437324 RepID=A0A8J3ESN7_9BACL|nr:hypothetical protein [Pullulanibacillus pueri]MBM7684209.1 hypothetical protein [Pullulanibacillus pueri]GGH88968.1 hypothetical protein GCM10007096_42500 [Pullulanibacillus pueri]
MSKLRKYQLWISLATSLLLFLTGITGLYLGLNANSAKQNAFTPGQGTNFNGGAGRPNWGGNNAQGSSSDDSGSSNTDQNNDGGTFSDSDQAGSDGSTGQDNMMPRGNFSGGFPGQTHRSAVLQFLQGTHNGTDTRWMLDVISGLLILIALAGGFTTIQTMRKDSSLKTE